MLDLVDGKSCLATAWEMKGDPIVERLGMADMVSGGRIGQTGGFITGRDVALDYLRSFGVLLVLLHHTVLAYVTFGFLNPTDPRHLPERDRRDAVRPDTARDRKQPAAMGASAFCVVFFAQFASATSSVIWQTKVPLDVQGRVFAYRGMIASIASPIGMILAGTLADYLFEPMMQSGGWGDGLFGWLVGTGPGAGMGLMMVLAGAIGVILGLSGFVIPSIRNLERLIPDCENEPEPGAVASDPPEAMVEA